jgi:hypothetical protein
VKNIDEESNSNVTDATNQGTIICLKSLPTEVSSRQLFVNQLFTVALWYCKKFSLKYQLAWAKGQDYGLPFWRSRV